MEGFYAWASASAPVVTVAAGVAGLIASAQAIRQGWVQRSRSASFGRMREYAKLATSLPPGIEQERASREVRVLLEVDRRLRVKELEEALSPRTPRWLGLVTFVGSSLFAVLCAWVLVFSPAADVRSLVSGAVLGTATAWLTWRSRNREIAAQTELAVRAEEVKLRSERQSAAGRARSRRRLRQGRAAQGR